MLSLIIVTALAPAAGIVDHASLASDPPVELTWCFGDRETPARGVRVRPGDELPFTMTPETGRLLTLELREFRTADGQSPAYVVSVNGHDVAFRCRRYDGAGFSSAFIDLPNADGPLRVGVRNVAPHPLHLSEANLYEDIETHAREAALMRPMRLGPTVPGHFTPERLAEVKALIPETAEIAPLVVDATFAIAHWPPEAVRERLRQTIAASVAADVPVELHLNTWWAGTPSGCDGAGGRWIDPEYQQVTFDPATGRYGLSVPNHWSSVPWLTTRHPRLNAYKARCFRTFGQLVRAEWDAFGDRADSFPIHSVVIDNEVTYWGAGNPGTPSTLQADFNPSVVAAARTEGITLDPRDGLTAGEMDFLRRSLRRYNREMADGLLSGLGDCRLASRVYTHTFMRGWCFDHAVQATEVGVLDDVRMGGEWGEVSSHGLSMLDVHRELGVPADINCELGGASTAANQVNLAYAAGCDHISLFNLSDDGVRATVAAIGAGWQSFLPEPWRPSLFREDFEDGDSWRDTFEVDGVHVRGIGDRLALAGTAVGKSGFARFAVAARELVGKPTFGRLCLNIDARAFLFRQVSADSYLAIRVGAGPDSLTEVARFTNMAERRRVDLTEVVRGESQATIEFELHPLGLAGWVAVFDCTLEQPWAEEALLGCNRSYRADRLRAESAIVAHRAEAAFPLVRRPVVARPYTAPSPDRTESGEVRGLAGGFIAIDPYEGGFMNRRLPIADRCQVTLTHNGAEEQVDAKGLLGGDDVTLTIRDGRAARIAARRGSATGRVTVFEPATAFGLPVLQVDGAPAMHIDSRVGPRGRITDRKPAYCPLVVGSCDFQLGDTVSIRWNPHTQRITAAELIPPGGGDPAQGGGSNGRK